ncbi:MAG: ATPase, type:Heavy metal-(Cd/Co/Hg/Pb/Zn)-translocating P-type ATPase:Heavy metal [Proteobacteria bacterium]|nr:ATPase, type:Heavy metal-(Cd/Co/Hg/Pb/Zn)-translocating P-type ATPase:Heavy metal [Pseudomonadota bacterium]
MPTDFPFKLVKDHSRDGHGHSPVRAEPEQKPACCGCGTDSAESCVVSSAPDVPAGMVRSQLRIAQMCCPTEEGLIRKKLGGMAEVGALDFKLLQRSLTVVHQPGALPVIEAAIRSLGMTSEVLEAGRASAAGPEQKQPWWPLALAGAAAAGAEALHWLGLPAWLVAAVALLAVAACGLDTYRKGWISLRHGNLNINALMSIAVTGAFLIGQWPEAAMVMVLFTIAELIEAKSLDRVRNAIHGLMQLTPERATVQQADGSWAEVESASVAIGSRVRVRPGERIGLDGVLVAGQSSVNQAAITGESLPVEKAVGDAVFAGTLNQSGSFEYRVSAAASNSTLARIIHAVEAAQGSRAPIQRFIDQFARIYTPAVFAIAVAVAVLPPLVLGGGWFDWIYKALVLLVIACPCALVISTPVSIVSGLAAAARHGILIKGGVYLETGRKLKWLAIDKTGTLTHGKPVMTDSVVLEALPGLDAVRIATSLATRSDHPVSLAIAEAGRQAGIALLPVDGFTALPGRGVQGRVDGVRYQLGNHRFIHELGVCSGELEARLGRVEEEGKTVILLTDGQRVLALFAVADTVKAGSRAAVEELHALGIKIVMLSGDNAHTARAIAAQVGIGEARGDQLPEDKLKAVEALARQGAVGMVGDGINDAPALARADIGFAMGAAGTDTAIETADVALMDDDLGKIARFVRLSQATYAVLAQNIALALGIKAVFLVLTVMGLGTMWMAVFADMGTSLLVVGNGLRLLRK